MQIALQSYLSYLALQGQGAGLALRSYLPCLALQRYLSGLARMQTSL